MNVTELARRLKIHPKQLLEILPLYGFDIGKKAIKIDNKVALQIMKQWKYIKSDIEKKRQAELEEHKQKERELRKESGATIYINDKITVRELAEKLNMSSSGLISELMKNGILANQNQFIDYETSAIMAEELGFTVEKGKSEDIQDDSKQEKALEHALSRSKNLQSRAPVVVVMGHVDHGKTRLLDTIRKTNIIDTEAGGITQHIGAYQTTWKDPKTKVERNITFIDTPGHEAFTVMRSRGAKVADIAILVVAADDGVKPQTKEVIQIIKATKIPFVVAINKIDKEGADAQKTKTELSQHGVITEDWGGNVPMVEISAKEKLNIDKLLDVLLLIADINQEEIKADPDVPAVGTIIESHVDKGMGPVATVLVQSGTLQKNDPLVVNNEIYGKVKAMKDYMGGSVVDAGPSVPVQIIGFKVAPAVGDILDVGTLTNATRIDIKAKRVEQGGAEWHGIKSSKSDEDEDEETKKKTINLIVKADVLGSLEAIIGSLESIRHDEVGIKIIGKGLGNITEDDVAKVEAGNGFIVGFNVKASSDVEETMYEKHIQFLQFSIIYDLINWIKEKLEKLLDTEKIITEIGNLKILAIFRTDKGAMTVGGRVEKGKIKPGLVRIKRDNEILGTGKIVECQIGNSKEKEVNSGTECGLRFEGKIKIQEGDVLESYTEESKVRKIEFKIN